MYRVILGAFFLASLAVTGCNTFEGVGKDVEGAGESLKETAHESKEAIHNHR